MKVILSKIAGKKTYLAAVGLAVLGVAELCAGDVPLGLQTVLASLTAAGLRDAIARSNS